MYEWRGEATRKYEERSDAERKKRLYVEGIGKIKEREGEKWKGL